MKEKRQIYNPAKRMPAKPTRRKRIMLALPWQLNSSHQVLEGVSQYVEAKPGLALQMTLIDSLQNVRDWEIEGLIAAIDEKREADIADARFPVVSTNAGPDLALPSVDAQPEACGALAAEHLLDMGHTYFATACLPLTAVHSLRTKGYEERLEKAGFPCVAQWEVKERHLDLTDEGEKAANWLLSLPKPCALFCTDDRTAAEMLYLAERAGIPGPPELCVMGCGDEPAICRHTHPPLSSIRLPYRQIGFEAARMVDQLIHQTPLDTLHIQLPPEQVTIRMSTNVLATEDPQLRKSFAYIQDHFAEEISVDQIAQAAGASIRTLQRRFKSTLGRTVKQELNAVRIEEVKRLLRRTDLTLTEIAEQTGFCSEYWMGYVFKNQTGLPPGAYRKQYRLR